MSNLLNAEQNPPFGWVYTWTPLDDDGIPKIDVSAALKQPETTRVRWDTVPHRGANGDGQIGLRLWGKCVRRDGVQRCK